MPQTRLPEYLYKMVHVDDMEYVLSTGLCCANHPLASSNYRQLGDPRMSRERETMQVSHPSGGTMFDYVPFYFAGRMGVLWTMLHADERFLEDERKREAGYPPTYGSRRTQYRHQREIVFVVCDFGKVIENCSQWCFTDRHPSSSNVVFFTDLRQLSRLDWNAIGMFPADCHNAAVMLRRQAEFLVRDFVPVSCIDRLVVRYAETKQRLDDIVCKLQLDIPVEVDRAAQLFFTQEGKSFHDLIPPVIPVNEDRQTADEAYMDWLESQGRFLIRQADILEDYPSRAEGYPSNSPEDTL